MDHINISGLDFNIRDGVETPHPHKKSNGTDKRRPIYFARRLPYNEDAERLVLFSLICYGSATREKLGSLAVNDFFVKEYAKLYSLIDGIIQSGKHLDPITFKSAVANNPVWEQFLGGEGFIEEAISQPVPPTNASQYANVVRSDALRRRQIEEAEAVIAKAFDADVNEFLDKVDSKFDDGTLGAVSTRELFSSPIPPRQWVLGNTFCRKYVSSLIATGGTGKTALRIAELLSIASGRTLTGEYVFHRTRCLMVTLEDDMDELRRRIDAAMKHYGVSVEETEGWLYAMAVNGKGWKLATMDEHQTKVIRGELSDRLEKEITKHDIGVVCVDPFVKAHSVAENDNTMMDQVAAFAADIASRMNVAVDLPHHTNKQGGDPGDPNSSRGASATKDAGRLNFTLTAMNKDEAGMFGVSDEDRVSLIRLDTAKVNIVPRDPSAKWFKLVSVNIGNGTEDYPNGDNMQVAEPWTPPDVLRDLTPFRANQILDVIAAGPGEGEKFSSAPRASDRAAWKAVQSEIPELNETQCRSLITMWLKNGVVKEEDYKSPKSRRNVGGLTVVDAKRPG